jgi:Single-strand binding protein family
LPGCSTTEKENASMSIDAALLGIVVRDAELRMSAAGKPWMSVIVRSGDGDAASFVQVAIFGDAAIALGRLERNEKLYAEGSIRISEWTTAAGEKRTGLSMAAWRAERPGVGRNKPKRSISRQSGVPPGATGDRGRARQTAGGHDSGAYQMQQGNSSSRQSHALPERERGFFNDDVGL